MTMLRPIGADGEGHLIGLDDLDPSVLDKIVNDVSGLTMQTVPVQPTAPADGIRVFTRQDKLQFVNRLGQAVDVLDSNLDGLTFPETDTPAQPIGGTRVYTADTGHLVAIGGSGTITVMAAP